MISIIVPFYNAEKFLEETLSSIGRQSYGDFEVICVDDGSADSSGTIARKFAENDARFHYFRKENAGPGPARNYALGLAKGDFIVFHDADDYMHPLMLETLEKIAREKDAELVVCNYVECPENARDFTFPPLGELKVEIFENDIASLIHDWKRFRMHPWGKLYRADVIKDLRFPDLRSGEDTYFNLDTVLRCKRMAITDLRLYGYRQNSGSLTHKASFYSNAVKGGEVYALHCLELFDCGKLDRTTTENLLQRYGTNPVFLGLILGFSDATMSVEKRRELCSDVRSAIGRLKDANKGKIRLVSDKYKAVYLASFGLRLSSVLFFLAFMRKKVLAFLH